MSAVHVTPLNDEREHTEDAECWCDPLVEYLDPETNLPWAGGDCRIIHFSADCRELAEGDGRAMAPGKQWAVLIV